MRFHGHLMRFRRTAAQAALDPDRDQGIRCDCPARHLHEDAVGRCQSRPVSVNGLKATDECQQINASNAASIYVWFRSFSTETTRSFGRNRNSCHFILPKPKTGRNCVSFGTETEFRSVSSAVLTRTAYCDSVLFRAILTKPVT